jgi:glycosyltransferase involved in cell wall biosynthesis
MKKRICILTTAHPADDVRVYRKMALSLISELDLVWIGPDTYWFENELKNDNISRMLYKNTKGAFGRLKNNYKALRYFSKVKKDLDFVYFPDPDIAFFFTLLINAGKIRKLFDIHEVYHKYLLNNRVNGNIYPFMNKLLQKGISRTVSKVDITMAVSDSVSKYYDSDKKHPLVVRNCLPLSFGNIRDNKKGKKEVFTVVHGKNHPTRGTMVILEALRILKGNGTACKVLMINTNNAQFDEYIRKHELEDYIDLHDGLPFVEMIDEMLQCHAGLVAYGRELGVDSLPNRIFEYMALSLPVIVPEYSTEMHKLVEQEKCGLIIDTEDPAQIAGCIVHLAENPESGVEMGERGRRAFLERHNWEHEISPLIEYLKK